MKEKIPNLPMNKIASNSNIYESGRQYGVLQSNKKFKKMIEKKINHYRTIYGVKKETVIQSAFIYEMKELLKELEDSKRD